MPFTAAEEQPLPPVRKRTRSTAPRTLSTPESSTAVVRRLLDYFMTRLPLHNCRLPPRGPHPLSTLHSAPPHISFSLKRSSYMVVCFVRFTALSEVNAILTHALSPYKLLESKHRRCAHRYTCRRVPPLLSSALGSHRRIAASRLRARVELSLFPRAQSVSHLCACTWCNIQTQTSLPCGARSSLVPDPLNYERPRCFVSPRRDGGSAIERWRRVCRPQR